MTKFDSVTIETPTNVLKIARPGLHLASDRKVQFDHHLAEKIIGAKDMPGERPLRPRHVSYLMNAMMRGTFRQELVAFMTCKQGKDEWRVNGQHTAMARLEMPAKWKDQDLVRVMVYEANSFDAVRELYASVDRGATRTRANVIQSYLQGTDQFDGVATRLVKLVSEGLAVWLWEGYHERSKHDADEVAWLMQHTHKTLVDVVTAFALEEPALQSCEWLRRAPVVAAMFETFSKVVQPSDEFWTSIKTGVGFNSAYDPRLRLRNSLQEFKMTAASTARSKGKGVDGETLYRWCINCFNVWRKGENLKQVRTTKERQRAR